MGRLIFAKEFADGGLDPKWYFPDTYYSGGRTHFTFLSGFPDVLCIHRDHVGGYGTDAVLPIRIRRWIESNISSSVIYDYLDLDYSWGPPEELHRGVTDRIEHGYHLFYFESAPDAVLFKLTHAGIIDVPSISHPRRSSRKQVFKHSASRAQQMIEKATAMVVDNPLENEENG